MIYCDLDKDYQIYACTDKDSLHEIAENAVHAIDIIMSLDKNDTNWHFNDSSDYVALPNSLAETDDINVETFRHYAIADSNNIMHQSAVVAVNDMYYIPYVKRMMQHHPKYGDIIEIRRKADTIILFLKNGRFIQTDNKFRSVYKLGKVNDEIKVWNATMCTYQKVSATNIAKYINAASNFYCAAMRGMTVITNCDDIA